MVIIDEKCMFAVPPPPYAASGSADPPPFSGRHPRTGRRLTISDLPAHILIQILYRTFPQGAALDESPLERQRKTLYWFSISLRLVNRAFYTACMHILRSTYLPAYSSLVRPPYSSDPFPLSLPSPLSPSPSNPSPPSSPSPLSTLQRETAILDLFVALKVREDVWADDSELHLERDEGFGDLFALAQPRARLEDLVRVYGVREGVVGLAPPGASGARSTAGGSARTVPFSLLSVSFSPRRAGLVLAARGRRRTIVEVQRSRDEKLESAAKRLVRELKAWVAQNGSEGQW